ncbi:hypothetical protein N7492_006714 [Penicillium capsulatum]|uniref:Uncharacterized protein n=1 Tax=Penicillium capsulatum TaxID=69766 RepID=A0A9W9I198_9EURO|nr:hypothetical protein N7492_006714 [Penicillium capsulatum]KAJ6116549.1 hypothetical protein N7512_006274 [Penicillium capsulatum]
MPAESSGSATQNRPQDSNQRSEAHADNDGVDGPPREEVKVPKKTRKPAWKPSQAAQDLSPFTLRTKYARMLMIFGRVTAIEIDNRRPECLTGEIPRQLRPD